MRKFMTILMALVVVYIIAAFTAMTLNPLEWEGWLRFVTVNLTWLTIFGVLGKKNT